MLAITIEGKNLFLKKDTAVQLEVKNSIFDTEKIEGEILFTFDVPYEQNEIIFQHAKYVYVQRSRKYQCVISAFGVEIGTGELYLQKIGQNVLSCGVIVNPYPTGFSIKKLGENDYGEDIIISETYSEHHENWLLMLKKSLEENSPFRFPLFLDEKFQSENDNFGFYNGVFAGNKYVNRLFTNNNGEVIEAASNSDAEEVRVFNSIPENTTISNNAFSFAPAFHLYFIIERIFESIGYTVIGNFTKDEKIQKIIIQSLCALDASFRQYYNGEYYVYKSSYWGSIVNQFIYQTTVSGSSLLKFALNFQNIYFQLDDVDDQNMISEDYEFIVPIEGRVHFYFRIWVSSNDICTKVGTVEDPATHYLFFIAIEDGKELPTSTDEDSNCFFKIAKDKPQMDAIPVSGQFGFSSYKEIVVEFDYTFSEAEIGKKYKFHLGRYTQTMQAYSEYTAVATYSVCQIEYPDLNPINNFVANIFSKKIRIADHVPGTTNSQFIIVICNIFGLSYFVDSQKKQVEFSFFKDILRSVNVLDLSRFLLNKEGYIENQDEKRYIFTLPPLENKKIDNQRLINSVDKVSDLPRPVRNRGNFCFVRSQNQYYTVEVQESSTANWIYSWQPYSGNIDELLVGNENFESETIAPAVKIPGNIEITNRNTIPIIEIEGISQLYNSDDTDFELILLNYVGNKIWRTGINYQRATPVNMNEDGTIENCYNLCGLGENSVGEVFAAPWLNFLSSYEPVTHKFLFDQKTFLEVIQLLKPQSKEPDLQIRWVVVDNVKLLPISMTFEFREGSNFVLAQIKFAKYILEL